MTSVNIDSLTRTARRYSYEFKSKSTGLSNNGRHYDTYRYEPADLLSMIYITGRTKDGNDAKFEFYTLNGNSASWAVAKGNGSIALKRMILAHREALCSTTK